MSALTVGRKQADRGTTERRIHIYCSKAARGGLSVAQRVGGVPVVACLEVAVEQAEPLANIRRVELANTPDSDRDAAWQGLAKDDFDDKAEKNSKLPSTNVTVALVDLIGMPGAALLSNWDKIFSTAAPLSTQLAPAGTAGTAGTAVGPPCRPAAAARSLRRYHSLARGHAVHDRQLGAGRQRKLLVGRDGLFRVWRRCRLVQSARGSALW